MKFPFLLGFLFWGVPVLFCQDLEIPQAFKHEVHLGLGWNHGWLNDLNFSPLHYREGGLGYELGHSYTTENALLRTRLSFSSGGMRTDASPLFETSYLFGNLQIGYLPEWKKIKKDRMRLFIGPQYQFYIHYLDWDNQTAFSFLATHSLDLSTTMTYQLSEQHTFSAHFSLPVINLLVRPPYNGYDEELASNNEEGKVFQLITDGPIGSFNQLFLYTLSLEYQYALTKRLNLQGGYQHRYQQSNLRYRYRHFQNFLHLGLSVNF